MARFRVVVTDQVVGYQKKSIQTQESIELVALDLPETEATAPIRGRGQDVR